MSDSSSNPPTPAISNVNPVGLVEDKNNSHEYSYMEQNYVKPEPDACFDSIEEPYHPVFGEYSDVIRYTPPPHNLITLEPYRPESNSVSPPMYTKMNPVSYISSSGQNDDAAVVPTGLSPINSAQDGGLSPNEDYRNLAWITPTLFEIKKEQSVFFSEDIESMASPASSSTSSASWLQTMQAIDDPKTATSVRSPSDAISTDQIDGSSTYWECVNCGALSSEADAWWLDKTGHFLCSECNNKLKMTLSSLASEKSPKQKLKKSNLQNVIERLSPIPSRSHRSNNARRLNQVCSNCHTSHTSLWRRSNLGETVCNACGLYYKLHQRNRPVTMRKDSIQKRKRKPKTQKTKLVGSGMLSKFEESVSVDPPSYSSHLAMTNGLSRSFESNYVNTCTPLPPVHSPDGFSHQLPQYGLSSPPIRSSYALSTPSSIASSMFSNYGPISSSSPSPTIASLLQSPHPYIPFGDAIHSSANLQAVYTA